MKRFPLKIRIISFLIVGIIPVILYFYKFHNGLSEAHSRWAEFGSFLSPMVGFLAFAGVLYSIELTKNQFKQQSEDNGFFSLIGIYRDNIDKLNNLHQKQDIDPFSNYIKRIEKIYREHCYYFAQNAIINDIDNVHEKGYEFLYNKIKGKNCLFVGKEEKAAVKEYFEKNIHDKNEALKVLVDGNSTDEDKDAMKDIGALYFEDCPSKNRIEKLSTILEHFDDSCGEYLSHYFQYMYTLLEYIDQTGQKDKFAKILVSLLSRNEIILLFYNSVSPFTDKSFNKLLFKYRIFDNLYTIGLLYNAYDTKISQDLEVIQNKLI